MFITDKSTELLLQSALAGENKQVWSQVALDIFINLYIVIGGYYDPQDDCLYKTTHIFSNVKELFALAQYRTILTFDLFSFNDTTQRWQIMPLKKILSACHRDAPDYPIYVDVFADGTMMSRHIAGPLDEKDLIKVKTVFAIDSK